MENEQKTRMARYGFMILLTLAASLFIGLFLNNYTFLFPRDCYSNVTWDSDFFLYVGREIVEGRTPYMDFYDHKGMFHFFVFALIYLLGHGQKRAVIVVFSLLSGIVLFFGLMTLKELGVTKRSHQLCFVAMYLVLYGLYGTYYLSRFSLKESHKMKVAIVSFSLLSLLAVPSLQLASFYGDWTRFGASTTYAMYDALDTIPEEAKKENNILGIGTYTAIYDMENVHFYHKFANDNDWWVGQILGVQESLRELLSSENRPTYLIVSKEDATQHDYGELIAEYYALYTQCDYEIDIYKAK
ncbi:MAG: hypothetical protein MR990_00340 [Mollicutes bacterium]|nr:hypothetical protein [Mollicutes bacterium]